MFHQEDAGLNVDMAKLAFSKGIWSYVGKMENALRMYIATGHRPQGPTVSAVSLMKKVGCSSNLSSVLCPKCWKFVSFCKI